MIKEARLRKATWLLFFRNSILFYLEILFSVRDFYLSLEVQPLFDCLSDDIEACGRLEASYNLTLLVNEELGEVPLDISTLLVVRISLAQHLVENRVERMTLVPTSKALTFFQEFEERGSIVSVYLDLLVALELCAVCKLAELMNAFISTRGLLTKLVAREIKYFETLSMISLIKFLQFLILRCETTLCGGVDDEQHFVGILLEGNILSLSVFNRKFVNSSHFFYLYVCVIYISDLNLYDLVCKDTTFLLEYFNSFFKNSKNRTKS